MRPKKSDVSADSRQTKSKMLRLNSESNRVFQKLPSIVRNAVHEYVSKLEKESKIEMDAKNEAYSFILSRGLFFEFKRFHDKGLPASFHQAVKDNLKQLIVSDSRS